jgi:hypothetical protein
VIYESGVTEVRATHEMRGSAWVGPTIHTQGVEQTMLARSVAPPGRRSAALAGWGFVIGAVLLFDAWRTPRFGPVERFEAMVGIGALVIGWLLAKYFGRVNRQAAEEYEVWLRSWHCGQCGAVFSS